MKLAQLFSVYQSFRMGNHPLLDVEALTFDSRTVTKNHIFIAIRGTNHDSHQFVADACRKGAAGVVVEEARFVPPDYVGAVLQVASSRAAAYRLASCFYQDPAEKLFCVGVTGTNGKTSTTYMIEAVLNYFGLPTGVMGTINHHLKNKIWETSLTTPDAITLHKRLREFLALEAQAVAFEVSSHAISQERVTGLPFNTVVFTNLSRDHLDYHKNMEEYFLTKERLFRELPLAQKNQTVNAVINTHDEWGKRIAVAENVKRITYGESKSDYQFQILHNLYTGTAARLKTMNGEYDFHLPLPGRHNVYNAVAAIAVGVTAGASIETCIEAIEKMKGIPGRLQRVHSEREIYVYIDYAHTDDALQTVLTILQNIRSQAKLKSKIITVFGCGGDRDKGKRPLMAHAAIQGSDRVYVTTDNPRTEDPLSIIQDILIEVPKELMQKKVFVEIDRREAIRKAIRAAQTHDVVLIAGKGHENYQIIGNKQIEFSDYKVAGEYLNGL